MSSNTTRARRPGRGAVEHRTPPSIIKTDTRRRIRTASIREVGPAARRWLPRRRNRPPQGREHRLLVATAERER